MKSKPIDGRLSVEPLNTTGPTLSIPPEESGITTISAVILEMTWKKAEKMLATTSSICEAPGMDDAMCIATKLEANHILFL